MPGRVTNSSARLTPAQALTPEQRQRIVDVYQKLPEAERRARIDALPFHQRELVEEVLTDHAGKEVGNIDYALPADLEVAVAPASQNPAHLQAIDAVWKRIDGGEAVRVIIEIPVRHGKSQRCTRMGLAWWLNRNPGKRGIVLSHSEGLASQHSSSVRDMFIANPSLFSLRVDPAHSAASDWQFSGYPTGGVFATGVGGAVIGRGGDCVAGGTLISTEFGPVPIEAFEASQCPPRVLAYDFTRNASVWANVLAAASKPSTSPIWRVSLADGTAVEATADHLIYANDRWQRIDELKVGDILGKAIGDAGGDVLDVRRDLQTDEVRRGQRIAARPRGQLLLPAVFPEPPRSQELAKMRMVRTDKAEETFSNVFSGVLGTLQGEASGGQGASDETLSDLQGVVQARLVASAALLPRMCGQGAFPQDDRPGQFALQGRQELREVVRRDETLDLGARTRCVSWLRGEEPPDHQEESFGVSDSCIKPGDPPRERGPIGQSSRKPSSDVLGLSHEPSQVQGVAVSMVERVRDPGELVYDLQVEGCHNFFAGEVLVHNCILIDDPVKSRAEAESPALRQEVEDWYRGTIRSRLEPNGSIVIIMARWHEDDLVGRLLTEDPDGWEVIHLPALAIEDDPLGRVVGQALWPERYDEEALAKIRKDVKEITWAAQYQNDPISAAGTSKFDVKRFGTWAYVPGEKHYTLTDDRGLETRVFPAARFATVDLGSKAKKSDLTVVSTWDLCQSGELIWIGCVFGRPNNQLGLIAHQHRLFGGKHPIIIESIGMQSDYVIDAKRKGMPAHPISPKGDKNERAKLAQVYNAQRMIFVPAKAEWVGEALKQLKGFPTARHDDIVDTVSYAAHVASGTGLGMSKETRRDLAHIARAAA